jgi:hypothetical protein
MELYLLKSTLCLAIFYAFYQLILEKETMHIVKRFYLLGGILASFLVPLITFTHYVERTTAYVPVTHQGTVVLLTHDVESGPNYLSIIVWSIYVLGVVFFAFKFGKNLLRITRRISKNPRVRTKNLFHVLLNIPTTPHTFFHYIFLNKEKFEANEIPKEVLLHEQVHAQQKHSIDTVFIELVQIIFWFNPLIYFIKKAIKLNHEFLADQGVLRQGANPSVYQNILLAFSSGAPTPVMAHSLNYASIKKRFTVMKTITPTKTKWLKSLLVIPLVSLLLYGFSERELIYQSTESRTVLADIQQKSATPKEIAEYNQWAKKYNAQPKDSRVVILKDLQRMEAIYKKMTDVQKENSEPFPDCVPPPPPPPPTPTSPTIASLEPIDHLIRMARENAVFFYENKPISSDEAIDYLKKNGQLNIETATFKNSNPIVNISSKPYTAPKSTSVGPAVDPAAQLVEIAKEGGTFFLNGKKVSADEAIQALRENEGFRVEIDNSDYNHRIVKISGC